jgi:diguanylate cyclase (GGDEF)-like protein
MKILVVDDSATMRAALAKMLAKMGHEALTAESGTQAIALYESTPPDLVLLDVQMPGLDGFEVATRLRAGRPGEWIPLIFLSSQEDDEDVEKGIAAGGDDYLIKPVSNVVLNAKIKAMERIVDMRRRLLALGNELTAANRELIKLSQSDGLTGLANRRHLDAVLLDEMTRARRSGDQLAVILCDVDHFKLFNDHYGHLAGDDCLKAVASAIRSVCKRPADLAARYGGEEFMLVLPQTPPDGARAVAEKLLQAIAALGVTHAYSSAATCVTVSAGIASFDASKGISPAELIARADGALYQAKERGRNRFVQPEVGVGNIGMPRESALPPSIVIASEPGSALMH